MNIKILLRARIEHGRLIFADPVKYAKVISSLNGREVVVNIKEPRSQRSANQNNYYWGVVLETLADWNGNDADEWHEILKARFLSREVEIGGEKMLYARSTRTLTTVEFEDYLTKIREWASKHNVYILLPNEVDY